MIQKLKNFLAAWNLKKSTQKKVISMNETERHQQAALQAVAQLVGETAGALKDIDNKMIDDGSQQNRALKVSPEQIVREAVRLVVPRQASPVAASPQPIYQAPMQAPTTFAPPGVNVQSVVMLDANAINSFSLQIASLGQKMDTLISQIEILKTVEARFTESLERTLNKGAKTVTFKFDETQPRPVNATVV